MHRTRHSHTDICEAPIHVANGTDIYSYISFSIYMINFSLLVHPNFDMCAIQSYGLVSSELGIGHYCGHMVDYDEVDYFYGKHEIVFYFFC